LYGYNVPYSRSAGLVHSINSWGEEGSGDTGFDYSGRCRTYFDYPPEVINWIQEVDDSLQADEHPDYDDEGVAVEFDTTFVNLYGTLETREWDVHIPNTMELRTTTTQRIVFPKTRNGYKSIGYGLLHKICNTTTEVGAT
jgi:hypothetical protein